jgi:hypothetical protein
MKTQRYDGTDMRKILTGMVNDKAVCARIASIWPDSGEGLFASSWANLIGGEIIRYFRKYAVPPTRQMQSIYEEWSKTTIAGDEEVESVERFLQGISDEQHQDAAEYLIDLAGRHFNKVAMDRVVEAVRADLAEWQVEDAQMRFAQLRRINLGAGEYLDPVVDVNPWVDAFENDTNRPLVVYRGNPALQEFLGSAFQRGRLFAWMAPDKTGKTTNLVDFVYRAIFQRNHVAFFDTGDGNRKAFLQRLACRITGLPKYERVLKVPSDWTDELKFAETLHPAVDPVMAFAEIRKRVSPDALRVDFRPAGSFSVDDLDGVLEGWEQESGYVPDVVVVDYADILAPPKGVKDPLDQIDETWKRLHRIAQQRYCLVMTATQSSALAYGNEDGLLGKKHFSGRKTKLAHPDGIIGVNVSSTEKDDGRARWNWIVRRDDAFNEKHYVNVAGCMATGNPCILSKGMEKKKESVKDDSAKEEPSEV